MMDQTSFLSRLVEPVVGFLKTVPSTIRDGLTEVADAISPARKRRRTSDSYIYHPPQLHPSQLQSSSRHHFSHEDSFQPRPKRLRLSDASISNAAGPSVTTPAAFRPAQDLLAATAPSAHANPQIVLRDAFNNNIRSSPLAPYHENHFPIPNAGSTLSTPISRPQYDLDIENVFRYPTSGRRSSLSGLRGIWPSNDSFGNHRRSSIAYNHKSTAAQLYWRRVEERHREKAFVNSAPGSHARASGPFSHYRSLPEHSTPNSAQRRPNSKAQKNHYQRKLHSQMSVGRATEPTQTYSRIPPRSVVMKKKRFNTEQREQRLRRSHQAKLKKITTISLSQDEARVRENRIQPVLEDGTAKVSSNRVPMPFVEIVEKDSILGQKLLKMHGATLARVVKSQNRSRHRQLECWLAEQDLLQIKRKREESRRLNAMRAQIWKQADEPSHLDPKEGGFEDIDYWVQTDSQWDEGRDEVAIAEREKQITVIEEDAPFASLSRSAKKRLHAAVNDDSNYYEELARIGGCVIRGEDLRRLKPNCWLNDEVVNAYMALLTARMERLRLKYAKAAPLTVSKMPNVKIMNSFFYAKLTRFNESTGEYEYDYSQVRRWTRRFDVFSYDALLIPINQQNVHWTLGVIDFKNCRVEHLDSMGTGGSPYVRSSLMRWVRDEAEDKQKQMDVSKWKAVERIVPMQENSDDCGVFLCKFADFICMGSNKFTFSQEHMNYFRARMAHELLMGKA